MTILLLNPAFMDVTLFMPLLMQGTILTHRNPPVPHTVYTVPYVNLPGITNVANGTTLLNTRMTTGRAVGEKFIVFAYSEGCEVAVRWLRLHGPTSSIDPADLEFILLANPERRYGGLMYQQAGFASIADIAGFPADTPYTVTDFTRQYDGISDFPDAAPIQAALADLTAIGTGSTYLEDVCRSVAEVFSEDAYVASVWNAVAGAVVVHNWYLDVTLGDSRNVSFMPEVSLGVSGNVTYVWSPTFPLASLMAWVWAPKMWEHLDLLQRLEVEATYSRPVSLVVAPPRKPLTIFRRPVRVPVVPTLRTAGASLAGV